VLIHGGTSGIGTTAIMLARALGAVPFATVGSKAKCQAALKIGAEAAINYQTVDFVSEIRTLSDNKGADVVVDIVGGPYLERNVEVLALEGRLILIATLGGNSGTLPIHLLMAKRATIVASTLRPRTPAQKGMIAGQLCRHIWPMLPARSFLRPLVDTLFPLAEAAEAHQRMEAGLHVGKIILTP
jgi:NADPH:quinone reductase-like Zn-dependent oxidoreductase